MRKIFGIGLCSLVLMTSAKNVSAINIGNIGGVVKDTKELAQTLSIGDKEEKEIGAQVHPRLLADMGGAYNNKAVQNYVNNIGQKLAAQSTRKGINYTFTVVDTQMVNAFALPGGYVYVTRGILSIMNDEAELAAVLGHEIGHVEAKHGVERIKTAMLAQKGTQYASKVGGSVGPLSEELLGEITQVFSNIALSGYGRKQELESDRIGIRLSNDTNYDPEGSVRLFTTLLSIEGSAGGGAKQSLYASHPETKKRIQQAEKEIAKLNSKGTMTNTSQYVAIKKKI